MIPCVPIILCCIQQPLTLKNLSYRDKRNIFTKTCNFKGKIEFLKYFDIQVCKIQKSYVGLNEGSTIWLI